MTEPQQQFLQWPASKQLSWANYYIGPNAESVSGLKDQLLAGSGQVYLYGAKGVGKSHLLQAACQDNPQYLYLPLKTLLEQGFAAEVLLSIEPSVSVCLDDVDALVGLADWEAALFALWNQTLDTEGLLVVTGAKPVSQLGFNLADLTSRLQQALVLPLQTLFEKECQQALQLRSSTLGMVLNDEVAQFILRRVPRDMATLMDILQQLDEASLQEQRALTVPFVKQVLLI